MTRLPCLILIKYFCVPRYVAIISGLGIGSQDHNQLALQMFIDLITGQLGSTEVIFAPKPLVSLFIQQ